ncbi:MAG: 30S ribosomal protein S20 [Gammaproteobacteria bacterium]|nr:30S ribosomal protein S20 [Gammaproteobacteria bacterium]
MANTAQARKRARQAEKHRTHNASLRSALRTACKSVAKALGTKDKDQAVAAYQKAVPVIDKMARKGFIDKNKAARQKSRLNAQLKTLQG